MLRSRTLDRPARPWRLPSPFALARTLSRAFWRLNGSTVRRDLYAADYAGVRRVLDT